MSSFELPGELGSMPVAIFIGVVVIILYYILVFSKGGGIAANGAGEASVIQMMVWLLFVFLIIINGANYMVNTDVYLNVKNIFSGVPEVNVVQMRDPNQSGGGKKSSIRSILQQNEVFNIPENKYTYENARAICTAQGAKLASYQQIESAYRSGAEWGQYGWSENQNALFPTSQSTYDKLQTKPGHENDRGRPGINGGYIANPNVRFGVNCYGKKPKINEDSATYMAEQELFPKTNEELKFDKRVEYWKKRVGSMIVAPFNPTKYSK